MLAAGATVCLLGGTSAIPASVDTQVAGLECRAVRYGGADRYETAVTAANAFGDSGTALGAAGLTFPDALAAGPAAAVAP